MISRIPGASIAWSSTSSNAGTITESDPGRNHQYDIDVTDPRTLPAELYVDRYGRWTSVIGNTDGPVTVAYALPAIHTVETRILRYSIHTVSLYHASIANASIPFKYTGWLTCSSAYEDDGTAVKIEGCSFSRNLDVSDFSTDLHSADNARLELDGSLISVLGKGEGLNWIDNGSKALHMDWFSSTDNSVGVLTTSGRGVRMLPGEAFHAHIEIGKAPYKLMETRILWVEIETEVA